MKAGDLVTLSAYANGLGSLHRWSDRWRQYNKQQPIVGLVIKASPPRWGNQWLYEVRWMEADGPKGRDGVFGGTHFNRKDLKFVSRG